ncbi:hypothetical protein ANO14919_141890 [Xylariales sp. No.14919]|nr:hypothetical protein F5X98DRAFT_315529 [Xylaria grammica]GAW24598.1 hypothetical protein ANO14919_141890 [Xylariales sp. No.14919]
MDTIKKAAKKVSHSDSGPGASSGGNAGGAQEDYGDKGAEYINKNYLGDKMSREQREKVTDAGREGFEKATGKNVPSNISN